MFPSRFWLWQTQQCQRARPVRHAGRLRSLLAASLIFFSATAYAEPPGVYALSKLLNSTHMGRISRVFSGPDGMTGVVLSQGLKHTIAYLTPNGQYVFFGMLLNLATGKNSTLAEGERVIKKEHIITGFPAANATALAYHLHAITYGNPTADNEIILYFNTSNPKSATAVADMLELAHQQLHGKMAKLLAYRFIPEGPSAGWLLSGNLTQRRTRLYDYLQHQFPGAATAKGRNRARYNDNAAKNFPLPLPLAILDLPATHIDALMPATHAIAHMQHAQSH